jgi:hypothetical protein
MTGFPFSLHKSQCPLKIGLFEQKLQNVKVFWFTSFSSIIEKQKLHFDSKNRKFILFKTLKF